MALGVERDHVPGAEVVAVVALVRLTGARSEVGEVPRGAGCAVLVVTGHRIADLPERAPGLVIRGPELTQATGGVLVVPEWDDGVGGRRPQQRGRQLAMAGIRPGTLFLEQAPVRWTGDVTGSGDDRTVPLDRLRPEVERRTAFRTDGGPPGRLHGAAGDDHPGNQAQGGDLAPGDVGRQTPPGRCGRAIRRRGRSTALTRVPAGVPHAAEKQQEHDESAEGERPGDGAAGSRARFAGVPG